MSMKLDRMVVSDRVQGFALDHYLFVFGIMKGIALGIAALALLPILDSPNLWPQLSFWIASFSLVLVSHVTTSRGILLASYNYNLVDLVVSLAIGIIECLLFAILQSSQQHPDMWHYWWVLVAVHGVLAALMVRNRLAITSLDEFDDEMRSLATEYRTWLRRDLIGAAVAGFIASMFAVAMLSWILPNFPSMEMWRGCLL